MTEPTPDQYAEWRRLADEATDGPWEAYSLPAVPPGQWQMVGVGQVDNEMGHRIEAMFDDDAAFIAAARSAVPALLDEVERLTDRVDELRSQIGIEVRARQEWESNAAEAEGRIEAAEAELSNVQADYDRRGERLWRLATAAGHEPNPADNDATAEQSVADALAERARLREGVQALAEMGERDGRGNSLDLSRRLRGLLEDR